MAYMTASTGRAAARLAWSDLPERVRLAADKRVPPAEGARWFGPLAALYPYVLSRWGLGTFAELGDLPVPDHFSNLFRDWAARKIDFVSP